MQSKAIDSRDDRLSCLTEIQVKVEELERASDCTDSRITYIENKLSAMSSKTAGGDCDSRVQLLESKVTALEKLVQSVKSDQGTQHSEDGDVTQMEQMERDKRRSNIIIYRAPEPASDVAEEQRPVC